MKKITPPLIVLAVLVILVGCGSNKRVIYDLEGAVLQFSSLYKERVLFQFNEPITSFSCRLEKERINIVPASPVANIYLPAARFPESPAEMVVETIDSAGNRSELIVMSPAINRTPANLQIKELRLKYSKRLRQRIVLECTKRGRTAGFRLVLFVRGKPRELPFADLELKEGEKVIIEIERGEENSNTPLGKDDVKTVHFPWRLSQLSALIYILNSEESIIDSFLYFDSKRKNFNELISNKSYNYYCRELKSYGVKPTPHDIRGHSTQNIIRRVAGEYRVGL